MGAAGRVAGDTAGLQHCDRPPAPRELARRGRTLQGRADDADVDVEMKVSGPRRAVGTMVAVYQEGA